MTERRVTSTSATGGASVTASPRRTQREIRDESKRDDRNRDRLPGFAARLRRQPVRAISLDDKQVVRVTVVGPAVRRWPGLGVGLEAGQELRDGRRGIESDFLRVGAQEARG